MWQYVLIRHNLSLLGLVNCQKIVTPQFSSLVKTMSLSHHYYLVSMVYKKISNFLENFQIRPNLVQIRPFLRNSKFLYNKCTSKNSCVLVIEHVLLSQNFIPSGARLIPQINPGSLNSFHFQN